MPSKIKVYAISCSSDGEVNVRNLFVWGQFGNRSWLPTTQTEAKKRVIMCQKENHCDYCDYQIHEIEIDRTVPTLSQYLRGLKRAKKHKTQ